MKECPYDIIGCMFLHADSENCKFKEKCTKKLCQYKHLEEIETNTENEESENDEVNECFKCEKCDYKFRNKDDLKTHNKTHMAGSKRRVFRRNQDIPSV